MLKNALIIVSIVAALLTIGLTYIWASNINQEEINRAKLEMEQLRASRDSIKVVVAYQDSMQSLLQEQVSSMESQADGLRKQVERLEQNRGERQLAVRNIRQPEKLQKNFAETYPEVAYSDWGVTEVENEETGLKLRYLMIPFNFTETFIIDHQNSISYQKQRNKLLLVDSLQQQVGTLKDSLLILEQRKAAAYQTGYQDAFAKYEELNDDYVQLLRKPPKIEWGLPQWGVVAAGVAGGVLLGTQLK